MLRTLRQYAATAHGRHDIIDDVRAILLIFATIALVLVLCFIT